MRVSGVAKGSKRIATILPAHSGERVLTATVTATAWRPRHCLADARPSGTARTRLVRSPFSPGGEGGPLGGGLKTGCFFWWKKRTMGGGWVGGGGRAGAG